MGKNRTIPSATETQNRATGTRTSNDVKWDTVGFTNGSTLARFAGAIWKMDDSVQSISALAQEGSMEAGIGGIADSGGPAGRIELGTPFRGWDDNSCPPARRRGKKSTSEAEAPGRSRGGFGTKLHVRAEGNGRLLTFALTPGQQHDITMSETLLEQGAVFRTATGRKRLYPKRLITDKGYTSRKFRAFLRKHHIAVTIPHRENEHHKGVFDKVLYQTRNRVKRLFARLKQFRRIATRYEKRGENFAALITIAAIFLWSQFAYTP